MLCVCFTAKLLELHVIKETKGIIRTLNFCLGVKSSLVIQDLTVSAASFLLYNSILYKRT